MSTSPGNDPKDDDSLASGEAGDAEDQAFSVFYDRCSGPVYAVALRVLADQERAEKVTEEAFYQAWLRAVYVDEFGRDGLTWLLWLTHSLAVAAHRRANDPLAGAHVAGDAGTGQAVAAHEPAADPRRQMVEMAFWDGLTCHEIAASCHMTSSDVQAEIRAELSAFA